MPSLPLNLTINRPRTAPLLALAGVVTVIATLVYVVQLPGAPAATQLAAPDIATKAQNPGAKASRTWESIPAWHLFGEFDAVAVLEALDKATATTAAGTAEQGGDSAAANAASPPADPDSIAETRLKLTLNGVLHAATARARAIISVHGSAAQKAFAAGDEILPNVEVHTIIARQVIIVNAGVFEALRLPQPEDLDQHPRTAATERGRTAPAGASSLARND